MHKSCNHERYFAYLLLYPFYFSFYRLRLSEYNMLVVFFFSKKFVFLTVSFFLYPNRNLVHE